MNSSPKRASDAAGKTRRKDVNLDLSTARQMLPYVRSIVTDVVHTAQALTQLSPEQEALDDVRRNLPWTSRQRRYAVHDEIRMAQERITQAETELDALGVMLADRDNGAVDFPTRINNRPAAFTWRLGEDALRFWHYAGEDLRRPIPLDWHASGTLSRYRGEP
jgi:hypothetical protein